MKNKILIICGPTATGKTNLGIKLAKKFNGEIISADSRQVYKEMDIGTGKDDGSRRWKIEDGRWTADSIKVWMLDLVNPDQKFSVAEYIELAQKMIEDIWQKGNLPIIIGGTGFYIKGLVDGIQTLGLKPDWKLREELKNKKTEELQNILKKIWPEHFNEMNESDRNNPRRLVRAIEIAKDPNFAKASLGKQKMKGRGWKMESSDVLFIGLNALNEILYKRIDQRVEGRIKMGAEEEVRKLLKKGFGWENSVLGTTPGYMEWQSYFENKTDLGGVIKQWKFDEHSYARRQMTWFKKDKRINWFDISRQNVNGEIEKLVTLWYNEE